MGTPRDGGLGAVRRLTALACLLVATVVPFFIWSSEAPAIDIPDPGELANTTVDGGMYHSLAVGAARRRSPAAAASSRTSPPATPTMTRSRSSPARAS
jgi:hypothetical protein